MNAMQYASAMEIFQLLAAMVGLGLAMWGIWLAIEDAIELTDSSPNDLRRLIALGNMRGQLARMSVHGILVFVGVVSILLPPPPDALNALTELEQATFVRLGLITVTAILVIDAIMERRQRFIFIERVETQKRAVATAKGPTQEVTVLVDGQAVAAGKLVQTVVPLPTPEPAPPAEITGPGDESLRS